MKQSKTHPLTDLDIKRMKPSDEDLTDTGVNRGLRVRCSEKGSKSFIYRYRHPVTSELKQFTFAYYLETSLSEARVEFAKLKVYRRNGELHKLKKQSSVTTSDVVLKVKDVTLKELIDHYLTCYIEDGKNVDGSLRNGARKLKGQREVRRMLYADPVQYLGNYSLTRITSADIKSIVMDMILKRGANVQAGAVLRELKSAYDIGIDTGFVSRDMVNPVDLVKQQLKRAKVRLTSTKGSRHLDDEELEKLLIWLPSSTYTTTHKSIIRMALWTGCRTGELCSAKWEDINFDDATFRIKLSKNGAYRRVQLPTQAISFLKTLRSLSSTYVFPSLRTRVAIQQKQLTEQAWRMRCSGSMLDIAHWTPHDLRRTVRIGLARLKCPTDIAEAIIGHSPRGIEGTYNLYTYEDECREWLQRWANYLDQLQERQSTLC
ncbi:tyrosine-type recombinase/integrase [Aeromonas caviae]|uniref:tyrosine-type recombinase/integrase n=1 Tax=Aeromonas caviae TaxID=648 RepID=UPI002B46406C|nr:tyrosine-type recombinase/integrase [Aeromonas caviae]